MVNHDKSDTLTTTNPASKPRHLDVARSSNRSSSTEGALQKTQRARAPRIGARMRAAQLMAVWNAHRGPLPEAATLTPDRARRARSRLHEHADPEFWRAVVERMASSAFCRGEGGRGWRADFDFLLRPGTAERVLEGKYDGPGLASASADTITDRQFEAAKAHRSRIGGCHHDPPHNDWRECVRVIARSQKGALV